MKKPRVGQVYASVDKYWEQVETLRSSSVPHRLPEWAFDFISVHKPIVYHGESASESAGYSIMSPLCLLAQDGSRPTFEIDRFRTKADAINMARAIATAWSKIKDITIFVACCN